MTLWSSIQALWKPTQQPIRPNSGEYQAISVGDEIGPEELSTGADISPLTQNDMSTSTRKHTKKVYWCFWILGAGVLLSWNVLICTMPLLASHFDGINTTDLASYLSVVYCVGNLSFLWPAQREISNSSPSPKLRWSLLLLFFTSFFILFPTLPIILPFLGGSSSWTLPILIILTVTLSCATAYLQCAVFALAALWGSKETLAVMSGQGGIAVFVSGTQAIIAIAEVLARSTDDEDQVGKPSTPAGIGLWGLCSLGAAICIYAHKQLETHPDYEAVLAPVLHRRDEETEQRRKGVRSDGRTMRVFKKNMVLEFAVAWVFVVTLSVFPPITTSILSTQNPTPRLFQPGVFIPLHFLIFNIGDYIGRTYLPAIPRFLITNQKHILLQSLARILFIPLFLSCNVTHGNSLRAHIINSDIIYFVILILFGMTNGHTSSLCMIVASSPELNTKIDNDEKDVAGTLAVFCLVGGLAGGAAMSFVVSWLM